LQATFELIGREGIVGLSNRRIAAEAGVSLGSLTYHFSSQTELLRESLVLFVEEEVARLEAVAASLRARRASPEEIAAEVQRLVAESAERPERIAELELHLHAARDPALQEASRRSFAAYEGVAAAALTALRVPDPTRHAPAVVALMIGMNIKQQGSGDDDPVGFVEALRTVVRGARARAEGSRGASETASPRRGGT
jgi:DNA-binding transcriptional regulator YbjK